MRQGISHFQPSFDDLSTPLIDVTFCVLDLETTGGSPADWEITEIGAVKYRAGELLGTFQTLVDPGAPIPPSIVLLTGITHAMVVDAPEIETALPSFLEFIGDSVIIGHNVRFDLSFLNAAAIRLGYGKLANKSADTAALARRLIRQEVRNLRLGTLAAHFRSPTKPNHRALEDARATAHVFHALLERAGSLGVTNLDDLMQLPTAKGSPHYGKITMTDELPRTPGVYIFRDRNDTPIYVGKASNLRARVRQYFYGDKRRTIANMMNELHRVEHQACRSLLEAEITEVRLIHAHRPRYNRRSKPPKTSHFVKVTAEKYPRLSVVRTLKDDGLAYLGPFRSKKAAELVVHAIWDAVPIRRCNNRPGSRSAKCAQSQLGVALCPCDGNLSASDYSTAVETLLAAVDGQPSQLLDNLVNRMHRLSVTQRYEEAGWVRDRHDALATALKKRWQWQAISSAGSLVFEHVDGWRCVVESGLYVGTSQTGELRMGAEHPLTATPVPPSVQVAEEADLIWAFVEKQPVVLADATGPFAYPLANVQKLTVSRRLAA